MNTQDAWVRALKSTAISTIRSEALAGSSGVEAWDKVFCLWDHFSKARVPKDAIPARSIVPRFRASGLCKNMHGLGLRV